MRKTEELQESKEKLEADIKDILYKFIEENGFCEIKIFTDYEYIEQAPKKRVLTGFNLEVSLVV